MVQLVTSKPSDVGTGVRISVQSHELGFFLTKIKNKITKKSCPTSGERLIYGYTKFDFTADEGKGRLDPARDKKSGKHRKRKVKKSCVTFLLYDPGWCVHKSDVQNKWDDETRPRYLGVVVYCYDFLWFLCMC